MREEVALKINLPESRVQVRWLKKKKQEIIGQEVWESECGVWERGLTELSPGCLRTPALSFFEW